MADSTKISGGERTGRKSWQSVVLSRCYHAFFALLLFLKKDVFFHHFVFLEQYSEKILNHFNQLDCV